MKFIHIADLHLGKRLNDISLLDDQKYALEQILEYAPNVDAVIIAGDIYDKSSPTPEAMSVFDDFLTKLSSLDKKVYMISGNHDNDVRISYFSSLIRKSGINSQESFEGKLQSIDVDDEYGKLHIHLLPFIKPQHVKRIYKDVVINTYEDAIKVVLNNSEINKEERNILLCHQFITGSELCDSEELAVGGLDNIDYKVFDDFDYVALGHIHKPQYVGRETLRYSGSLFKYSLSESSHTKSFCVVDIKEKGNININLIPLQYKHDVRTIEGKFDEIMKMPYSEDYVRVILHDEEIAPDARVRLLTVFPNMMKFAVVNSKTKYDVDVISDNELQDKSVSELFVDFFSLQNNGEKPSEKQLELFDKVLKELEG